jgi:hypothetical protein
VAAAAAPLVPSGDLPGRERYGFTPLPLDRFVQPSPASSRSCVGIAARVGPRDRCGARSEIGAVEIAFGGAADDRGDDRGSS